MTVGLRPHPLRSKVAPVSRSGPPMFVFGIGAAKAGTTWLYRYLRAHPECHLRGHKELHYFDVIEKTLVKMEAKRLEAEIAAITARLPQMSPDVRAKRFADVLDKRDYHQVLATCYQDKNAYFRYMMGGLGNQRLVADITPDYAGVSVDMLRKMAASADETRFVYLMRDPVARFWSHVRMVANGKLLEGEDLSAVAKAELAHALSGEEIVVNVHSSYAHVLEKMEAAIPENRRLVMFYEDLMTSAGLRKLCKFLGIKPKLADFNERANEGKAIDMTSEERAAVRRLLRPQYEAVASRFPVLPKAWQKTMAEGFA
jgi:hypothetical protein